MGIGNLHIADWITVVVFFLVSIAIGLGFTKRAGKDISTFFVSGRSLPWYVAGISILATNFASDTPLWVTSLVRQYGVHTVWQYWAFMFGSGLCVVYIARLWRRLGVVTDIEFLEIRYSGKPAAILRCWSGLWYALFFCPLVIAWVTKAMETIAREAMGFGPELQVWTTVVVVGIALVTCVFSGLSGVVYTDLLQFAVAWGATFLLAFLSVHHVGGISAMLDALSNMQDWHGRGLDIAPKIGPSSLGMLSIWNVIGYFGIFWIMSAVNNGFMNQRLLACKNSKHASYAQLLHTVIYWGLLAWPWIIVALCSLILMPDLGEGVSHDSAYPRMIITIMPIGLRGLLIAGMLGAFISTINTLMNWGSSYLVNDVYQRFLVKEASDKHYVFMARITTFLLAAAGAGISILADNIQQLLEISYAFGSGISVILLLRFFWPRLNAWGEIAASVVNLALTFLLISGQLNEVAAFTLRLTPGVDFVHDYDYLGARMLLMIVPTTMSGIIVSLLTPKTDPHQLAEFVNRAKPLRFFWKRVIEENNIEYGSVETVKRTLGSWAIIVGCVLALIFGSGKLLLGAAESGIIYLGIFLLLLFMTVRRVRQDFEKEGLS